ncbi:restriction endonuclease subunit S [Paenilisteria newyorkensis]|uniref:restriction endonuclease subunit S n=1 Tax=Listeria newyorkensis TaxID=1497681 RepID=UPI00066A0FCF|nr:restriction endonuclease subunit S [Listeria newyorkensis]KMT63056.1 Type I restriction-modification system DNA methylase [Listeria newyorkensis]
MIYNWELKKLIEIIDVAPKESLKKGETYKKISMDKLTNFSREINDSDTAIYNGGTKFRNGDTLIARITPCLENGKTAFVSILDGGEVAFGSTEFFVIRAKKDKANPLFVYYLSISEEVRKTLIQSMTGTSGRQRAQKESIQDYEMKIPPLKIQERIGFFLGELDSKIEINRKIILTLEEIASALFKRWFVDFEYPDENGDPYRSSGGKMQKSELGDIPLEWRIKAISDIAEIQSGGTPNTRNAEFWGGEIPFYTPKDSSELPYVIDTEKHLSDVGIEKCNSKLYPQNTIFITARGTVGKINLAGRNMAMNQSCYAIKNKESFQFYQYFLLKTKVRQIKQSSNGAVFNAIVVRDFNSYLISHPNVELIKKFENIVTPMFEQISMLTNQMETLANLRDTLLPKLLSGELELPTTEEV